VKAAALRLDLLWQKVLPQQVFLFWGAAWRSMTWDICRLLRGTRNKRLTTAITEFFVKYNELQGKKFRSLGMHGPDRALEIVKNGMKSAKRNGKRKK
jgi:hypothetical protein